MTRSNFDNVDEHLRLVPETPVPFHEAGHVVAIWALGANIGQADVIPEGRFGGRALFSIEGCRGVTLDGLIIAAAGPAASRRWDATGHDWGDQDREDLERGLRAMCRSTEAADILRRHIHDRAKQIVEENWDAVEAVADGLLARGVLTGDELREILDDVEHRRGRKRWRAIQASADAPSSTTTESTACPGTESK